MHRAGSHLRRLRTLSDSQPLPIQIDDWQIVDDTEPIAFRVGHHYVVGIRWAVVPGNLHSPEADQTLNLGFAVVASRRERNTSARVGDSR